MEYLEKIKEIYQSYKIAILVTSLGLICIGVFFFFGSPKKSVLEDNTTQLNVTVPKISKKKNNVKEKSTASSEMIVVDLKGAVNHEGTYEVKLNSRLTNLITLAGGFTEEADKTSVNLSQKLTDEMVIYVAKKDENKSIISSAQTSSNTTISSKSSSSINLNTADLTELQKITGIGEKKAKDIIAYREANAGFKSVEELAKVSGIGQKTIEKIKSEVCVD